MTEHRLEFAGEHDPECKWCTNSSGRLSPHWRADALKHDNKQLKAQLTKCTRAMRELRDSAELISTHYERLKPNHLVCDDYVVTSSDLHRLLKAIP